MGICTVDAVTGSNVELSTTSVRTELATVSSCKNDINSVVHQRVDDQIQRMIWILGVIAKRMFVGAVENGPRIDEDPRPVPRRSLTQRPNNMFELMEDM